MGFSCIFFKIPIDILTGYDIFVQLCPKLSSLEATRRREGVEFVFCHLIIETLQQLSVHPIPERDIQTLLNLAFEQFEDFTSDSRISELYAEALGVISEHRHHQVRHRFLAELRKLRSTESSTEKIASVLNGMKFFKGMTPFFRRVQTSVQNLTY